MRVIRYFSARGPLGRTAWVVVVGAILTVAELVRVAAGLDRLPHAFATGETLYLAVAAIAVLLSGCTAWAYKGHRRIRVAWALATLALAAFFLGEVMWDITDLVWDAVGAPTWADIGYLVYYPILLAALALLSGGANVQQSRLRVTLDVATIVCAGSLLTWLFVLRPAVQDLGSGWAAAVTVAYPVGDLFLILGVGLLAVRRNLLRSRSAHTVLLLAVVVGFIADLAYGQASSLGTYQDPDAIDVVYLVSWFLFGLAGALEYQTAKSMAPDESKTPAASGGRSVSLLPYLAIAFGLAVIIWALDRLAAQAEVVAVTIALLVAILAMARQVVAVRDNSRLREKEAVAKSEERFQHALRRTQYSIDHATDVVMWLTSDGRIAEINEAGSRLLEYSRDELLGLSIFAVAVGLSESPERWGQAWDMTNREGSVVFAVDFRTKSGRAVPVEVRAHRVDYEGEELSCAFVHDLSTRKQAEAALQEAQAQLLQSQKLEALGELAGGIAHEFNNLLAVMLGHAELIQSTEGTDSARSSAEAIRAAAQRGAGLTRQILQFSRRQPVQPRVVDVNDVIVEAEQLLGRTLGENIEVVRDLAPGAGRAWVDVNALKQALTHLVLNARDAMPGGGFISIATRRVEVDEEFCAVHPELQPGPHVLLTVSDTGTGMSEETRAHVFDPFYTTKDVGKGTGLGLSTVYGIVAQSKGLVLLESELGLGTTVIIYVPCVAEPSRPPEDVLDDDPAVSESTS